MIRYLPAVIWMAFIFYTSHQPGDELGKLLPLLQKVVPGLAGFDWGHFVSYYILALTYYMALFSGERPTAFYSNWKLKLIVILCCLIYGMTDEYHQTFVAGRTPDIRDLRNDTIGAALAMITVSIQPFRQWSHSIIAKFTSRQG